MPELIAICFAPFYGPYFILLYLTIYKVRSFKNLK
jgi:hypothetical protein